MKKLILFVACSFIALSVKAQTALEYANAGDAAMLNEKYEDAIDSYKKSLELDVDKVDYMTAMQLGVAYEKLEQYKNAGDAYKESLLRGNFDLAFINNMKKAYENAQCTECLTEAYVEVKEAIPSLASNINKRLYTIYAKSEEWQKAKQCVVDILAEPDLSDADKMKYLKYGAQIALNMNELDEAEEYYGKVLEITPDDADIHKAIGYGLYNSIQRTIQSTQNAYKAKGSSATNHDFATMQTAAKRATLNHGPKAVEHLKIANKTLNDPQITKIIGQLQQNITVYSK